MSEGRGQIAKGFCLEISNILKLTSSTHIALQPYASRLTALIWTDGIQFCVFNLHLFKTPPNWKMGLAPFWHRHYESGTPNGISPRVNK